MTATEIKQFFVTLFSENGFPLAENDCFIDVPPIGESEFWLQIQTQFNVDFHRCPNYVCDVIFGIRHAFDGIGLQLLGVSNVLQFEDCRLEPSVDGGSLFSISKVRL